MAGFASGETVTAAKLNRVQPTTYDAACSSSLTLSTTETDVTGATITLTTVAANAIYIARGVFDFDVATLSAANYCQGRLAVDGVTSTREANMDMFTVKRGQGVQQWRGTLAAAGSHTLKLRAAKLGAGGASGALLTHTTIQVIIYEVV